MISYILIGLISIISSIIVIYSGAVKTRNGTLKWQSISQILTLVCNVLTGSVYGIANAAISIFRNCMVTIGMYIIPIKYIVIIAMAIVMWNVGGSLPCRILNIASISVFNLKVDCNDIIEFKKFTAISAFISLLSNFISLNIGGFMTNFLFLIVTSFAITRLKMENDVSQHNSI